MNNNIKIGITERGDAAVHLNEWTHKAHNLDAIIAISKGITKDLSDFLLRPEITKKTILHATITGYGATALESGAPLPETSHLIIKDMIQKGFPAKQIVLRIDPIIPTQEGLNKVRNVLDMFKDTGISRVRFSFLQYYKHANERFKKIGWNWPYLTDTMKEQCFKLFAEYANIYSFQSCATDVPDVYNDFCIQRGCVSYEDLEILNIKADLSGSSYQRPKCLCCSAKTELLTHKHPCKHNCLYCYWYDK